MNQDPDTIFAEAGPIKRYDEEYFPYTEEEIAKRTYMSIYNGCYNGDAKENKYATLMFKKDKGLYLPIPLEMSKRAFFLRIPGQLLKIMFNHYLTEYLKENNLELVKRESSDYDTVKENENKENGWRCHDCSI